MKVIIESKKVKEAVVEFVNKTLLNGEYDTDTAKVVITKGGTAEVTIEKSEPMDVIGMLDDIKLDKGEEV